MKKVIFIGIVFLFYGYSAISQNQIGLKFGLSSYDFNANKSISTENIKLSFLDASYGFQAGAYARIGLLGFYLQPEICFNSNSVQYSLVDFNDLDTLNNIRKSSYKNLDIPVLFMITPSIFKLYTGPVAHYLINDYSDFTKKDKIKEMIENLTYGFQIGGAASLGSITVDIRYEGTLSKNVKSFSIDEKEFKIDDSPSRFIFSLWFKL